MFSQRMKIEDSKLVDVIRLTGYHMEGGGDKMMEK